MKKYKSLEELKEEKFKLKRELAENENYLKADISYMKNNYRTAAAKLFLINGVRFASKSLFKGYYLTKNLNAYKVLKMLRRR